MEWVCLLAVRVAQQLLSPQGWGHNGARAAATACGDSGDRGLPVLPSAAAALAAWRSSIPSHKDQEKFITDAVEQRSHNTTVFSSSGKG